MATIEQLTDWALTRQAQIGLSVRQYTFTEKILPGFTDTGVTLQIDGTSYTGRGTDRSKQVAFAKAICEAIERRVVAEHRLSSSNGVACHLSFTEACQAARLELLERDAFLCSFLANRPPIAFEMHSLPEIARYAAKVLKTHYGVLLTAGQYLLDHHAFCCGVFLTGARAQQTFGLILGLGCASDPSQAWTHALIEAVRKWAAFQNGVSISPMTYREFCLLPSPGPLDHAAIALHPDSLKNLQWVLPGDFIQEPMPAPQLPTIDLANIPVRLLESNSISSSQLFVAAAKSSHFQNLFFGQGLKEKINFHRIKKIYPDFDSAIFNSFPHPIS